MEGFAFALPELPANARVIVVLDGGAVQAPSARVNQLLDWVAFEMGVARQIIIGPSRVPSAVRARDAVSWGGCELLGRSRADVARLLGGSRSDVGRRGGSPGKQVRDRDPAFKQLTTRMAALFTGGVS